MAHKFSLVGSRVCLDFCNTVDERPGFLTKAPGSPAELLHSYESLIAWSLQAKLISAGESKRLREFSARHPIPAQRALEKALRVREIMFNTFLPLVLEERVSSASLEPLNKLLGELPGRRVTAAHDGLEMGWNLPGDDALAMLPAVIWDASMLLCLPLHGRLRVCAADDCGWLFLDTSKNGKRRWCDMSDCGNRAKAKTFYEQHRDTI